jgi:hypothetical protein
VHGEQPPVCYYHDAADQRLDPTIGYWIEAEEDGRVVGYLCSLAAHTMRGTQGWHQFRDAMRAQHPDPFFYLIKTDGDGERRILLAIADNV